MFKADPRTVRVKLLLLIANPPFREYERKSCGITVMCPHLWTLYLVLPAGFNLYGSALIFECSHTEQAK